MCEFSWELSEYIWEIVDINDHSRSTVENPMILNGNSASIVGNYMIIIEKYVSVVGNYEYNWKLCEHSWDIIGNCVTIIGNPKSINGDLVENDRSITGNLGIRDPYGY